MKTDAAIKRTRDVRRDISARAGDDPVKLVEYYMQMQNRFAARLCAGPGNAREGSDVAEQDLAADAQKDARR